MIRHSSSFFLSITFHGILLLLLFFAWKNYPSVKKIDCEKKVCVQLYNIVCEKEISKQTIKTKLKSIPKIKSKPKTKTKTTKKPKKISKPIIKHVEVIKEEPVVVEQEQEIVRQEDIKKEKLKKVDNKKIVNIVEKKQILKNIDNSKSLKDKQKILEESYLKEYTSSIVELLKDNLYYPRRARKRGIVGKVVVKFILTKDAIAQSIEVQSSKSNILSRAAIKTIENLSGKFPKPNEELILLVPINYNLK